MTTVHQDEVRWAVEVTHSHHGKRLDPFLAGRYYFDRYDGIDRYSLDDVPPVATFDTREAARRRCRMIRGGHSTWRTTARPVKVRVLVERVES